MVSLVEEDRPSAQELIEFSYGKPRPWDGSTVAIVPFHWGPCGTPYALFHWDTANAALHLRELDGLRSRPPLLSNAGLMDDFEAWCVDSLRFWLRHAFADMGLELSE